MMSYHHLTPIERGQIQALLEEKKTQSEIARRLGCDRATICREVRRNSTRNGYRAASAQHSYLERRKDSRRTRKMDHEPLNDYVIKQIRDKQWSPEQVAGRLPIDYPTDTRMRISHESVYRAIYSQDRYHFLIPLLARAHPKRRKQGQRKSRGGPIANRVDIKHRPAQVDDRVEQGHWEGDLIVGKNQDGFILTIVERKTGLTRAIKTETKTAAEVCQAVVDALIDMPISWVKTITFDNGSEFAGHEKMAQQLAADIYFAEPYSAWQRGTNENTNGLIRRYLPKGTSFKELTQRQLDDIVDELNNRPRKRLGYRTPNEVFQQQRKELRVALAA